MKLLTSTEVNSVKTHKPHQNYQQRGYRDTQKPQESQSPECRNCGYRHARYATCAAQGQKCKLCGKLNHFAKVCQSGKKHKPRKSKPGGKVHEFQAGDFPEDPQLPTASNFMIGSITQVNATVVRELHRSVRVHGNDIKLKVDSGADGNVIPNSVFELVRLQEETDTGQATEISSYFGTKLTTLGTTVLS